MDRPLTHQHHWVLLGVVVTVHNTCTWYTMHLVIREGDVFLQHRTLYQGIASIDYHSSV